MRNWPAFEIATRLIASPAGYARGAYVGGSGWFPFDARAREQRQESLDKLRAELFTAQQKSARGRD